MQTYIKIETPFSRDTEGSKKVQFGVWRDPTLEALQNLDYIWTEKIDGTNVRVHWDGYNIDFAGRTDRAELPQHLREKLTKIFDNEPTKQIFEQLFGEKEVILFGEGYGAKIQNGGNYIPNDVDFILFDIIINDYYLARKDVESIAQALNITVVPIVGHGTIIEAIDFVRQHPRSTIGTAYMEGIVAHPPVELYDKRGKRIITKIKYTDFKEEAINY